MSGFGIDKENVAVTGQPANPIGARRRISFIIPTNVAATPIAELAIGCVGLESWVPIQATISTVAGVAQDGTNYMTITIKSYTADGVTGTSIFSATSSTDTFPAKTAASLNAALSSANIAANSVITLAMTKAALGVSVVGTISIDFEVIAYA